MDRLRVRYSLASFLWVSCAIFVIWKKELI